LPSSSPRLPQSAFPIGSVVHADEARSVRDAAMIFAPRHGIVNDATASPRHRIEACRELRATAAVGSETNTLANERERFIININFGKGNVIHKELDLKPVRTKEELKIERDEDKPQKLIERDEEDESYEPEYDYDT
jgi:hypothetical protein